MEKHLTETELAERLGVKTRTVQNWRRATLEGRATGPAFLEIGASPKLKTIRYRLADVIAYEDSRRRGGESQPTLTEQAKRAIAADAALRVAKNAGVAEQLCFAPIKFALDDAFPAQEAA